MTAKDVFIIHSKREPFEEALVARLVEWLDRLAISFYEYDDWTWDRREPGPARYSSSGGQVDPVRFAMGHPEMFKRATWQQRPDREALDEMLGRCRIALIVAPRDGSPSDGVRVELQVLPHEPARIVASWGNQDDWVVADHRPGFVYLISATFDREQAATALDLAHLVWLHWFVDTLALDCGTAGRRLLLSLCARDAVLRRLARFASRVSRRVGDDELRAELAPGAPDLPSDIRSIVQSVQADEARSLVRHWFGRGRLHAALPPSRNPDVSALLGRMREGAGAFCTGTIAQHPSLADARADGLCLAASVVTAFGERDAALAMFEEALVEPGAGGTARSEVLAQRAATLVRSAPAQAAADIAAVVGSAASSSRARSLALWLRARQALRRRDHAAAVADLSDALQIQDVEPALRALCLHDRATCYAQTGHRQEALDDLDAVVRVRDLPAAVSGPARLDRAVLRGELGDVDGELADYVAVIDLEAVPDETRLKAHLYRGLTRLDKGDRLAAIDDFVVVRDDPASPDDARQAATDKLDALDPLK